MSDVATGPFPALAGFVTRRRRSVNGYGDTAGPAVGPATTRPAASGAVAGMMRRPVWRLPVGAATDHA